MKLSVYNKKRDFKQTTEPAGKTLKSGSKQNFVIQRHHASRLHYDFRLEMDGVLKSWAVPKGPSLNPKDKRLAVHVEDHPVSYKNFEGEIPEGNYGAGRVDIWDSGKYIPIDDEGKKITAKEFLKQYTDGSMKFILSGNEMQGAFALVRMKDEKNWLLIKHKDEFAVRRKYNSEDAAPKAALKYTARKKEKKSPVKKKQGKKLKKQPARYGTYVKPMLARLKKEPFNSEEWLFEVKWDGYRAIADIDGNDIKLYSRNGLSFREDYPEIYHELAKLNIAAVLDGEIVALNKHGVAEFQPLQQYRPGAGITLHYYVFDLISFNNESLRQRPLTERKALLKEILPESDIIKYCDHIATEGKLFFQALQKIGVEGMIAKKMDSHYIDGKRGNDWYKIKHILTDEAVIAGYTSPRGGRKYFGSLVMGVYSNNQLQYIGHVGTGFTDKILKELHAQMQPLVQETNPFGTDIPVNAAVTWIKPQLVANIKFTEITNDGIRRHPVFLGLRKDKEAHSVTGDPMGETANDKKGTMDKTRTISGNKVQLTNLDKVYWPDEGYTKGDVLDYYDSMHRYIIKYLKGRPESLKRNPNGISDSGFFHKDIGDDLPGWVSSYPSWSDSADKEINYLVCNDKASLLYMANLGCIELNPWSSTVDKPDHPDYIIIDLDPSEKNTFSEVTDVANAIHELLTKAGGDCYCKTSGATGLHIYIPLNKRYDYDHARHFSEVIATLATEHMPEIATTERSLKKRSKQKIYVDYLQNKKGQTICSAYSLRPRPGAPVSTPLEWKEVKHSLDPMNYHIKNTKKRLEKKGDLFAPVLKKGIDMIKVLKALEK